MSSSGSMTNFKTADTGIEQLKNYDMKVPQNKRIIPFNNLQKRVFHLSTVLLLIGLLPLSALISCSTDNADPILVETEQRETPEEEPETEQPLPEETPAPETQSDIAVVDNAITAFMAKHKVPGAAVAVSVNEKMVYTKGYGVSNLDTNTPTKPDDVFRLASLSKPFTSTAIMKLVDEGKLNLTDRIFGPDGVLGDTFGTAVPADNQLDITVDDLLIHAAGGWGTVSGDPIDREPQLNATAFIEYILNNWKLPNAPGTQFEYSNTAYWLLARVIEQISGESYEDYLKTMGATVGITSLRTTTFRQENRAANEVEYYGTPQDMQWIYSIASRRDGDGGVIINAPDMLRFMCAIDGRTNRQDLISPEAQELMASPSDLSILGRGLGTWKEQNLLFFTGSLPGTRTWFYMNANGVNAVILLNYRRTDTQEFDNDLNSLVYNLVKDTSLPWQTDLDQF